MTALTATKITSLDRKKQHGKYADGLGLYFVVPKKGQSYWSYRYTVHKKRREMTLGKYPFMGLADARSELLSKKRELMNGLDPLVARKKEAWSGIETMDHLFEDWFTNDIKPRLKHPNIPARLYRKEIKPVIGDMRVEKVNARDVREVLPRIKLSNRPSIANDVLMYMKQLFRHAVKLDLTLNNPASAFGTNDAGGIEKSRERALSLAEIKEVTVVFRKHMDRFGMDNYIAVCLYLVLGIRKSELTEASWSELDLDKGEWIIPDERVKKGKGIAIPLPAQAVKWFNILKARSFGSEYVLPARRGASKPFIGSDTINRAINKMFGIEQGRKRPAPNLMGDIQHFTVHDLRRTFRSQVSALGFSGAVGERAINHSLKGVEGIYDRYDYYEERRHVHQKIADVIEPLVWTELD